MTVDRFSLVFYNVKAYLLFFQFNSLNVPRTQDEAEKCDNETRFPKCSTYIIKKRCHVILLQRENHDGERLTI